MSWGRFTPKRLIREALYLFFCLLLKTGLRREPGLGYGKLLYIFRYVKGMGFIVAHGEGLLQKELALYLLFCTFVIEDRLQERPD